MLLCMNIEFPSKSDYKCLCTVMLGGNKEIILEKFMAISPSFQLNNAHCKEGLHDCIKSLIRQQLDIILTISKVEKYVHTFLQLLVL